MDQFFGENAELTEARDLFHTEIDIGEEFKYSQSYEFQRCAPVTPLQSSSKSGHKCPTCGKIYKIERFLKAHLRNECRKDHDNGNNASDDMTNRIEHENKENFKCNVCSRIYMHNYTLKDHVKREHGTPRIFSCKRCSYSSKIKGNLVRHVKLKHGPLRNLNKNISQETKATHACETCNKKYIWKSDLVYHKKFDCGKAPRYHCDHCNYSCKQKAHLVLHIKAKHDASNLRKQMNKLYKCEECNKSYSYKRGLTQHKNLECGKHPSFFCKHCDFSTVREVNLKHHVKNRHEAVHSRPKYKCVRCGKKYNQKGYLKIHAEYHCAKNLKNEI